MPTSGTDSSRAAGVLIGDRYEVIRSLGRGGMGEVLLVSDSGLEGEKVALKILYPNFCRDKRQVARFRNEVLLTRKLTHTNIVRVYEFGETSVGEFYISMEFVEGKNLGNYIDQREPGKPILPFPKLLSVLHQTANALSFAHSLNVVHRDLKPDNILLTEDGTVKLTDFGIARSMIEDKGLTATNEMLGTPYYMSPEQFRGSQVDHRADMYSFGIVAYELVTGIRPFQHENCLALSALHLTEPLPKMSTKERSVPGWYQDMVETCAEKDSRDRYKNMQEVADVIKDHMGQDAEVNGDFDSHSSTGMSRITSILRKISGTYKISSDK